MVSSYLPIRNRFTVKRIVLLCAIGALIFAGTGSASEGAVGKEGSHGPLFASTFLWIAVLLMAAKVSAALVDRCGQPPVLGELLVGIAIGNLALLGINFFEPAKSNMFLTFLAELGVLILLFQIGLESNVEKMRTVGARAFLVAIVGVFMPFIFGSYLIGPWLLPGLSPEAYLFLGAALTATSVGITVRVFRDLGVSQSPEAQIVLGAAVIDDVIGLVILAMVSEIATIGTVSFGNVSWIFAKAALFVIGSIIAGALIAPAIGRLFSHIHTGIGMKMSLALSFGLVFAYFADVIGLAPIVGAFAAGLVLDPVHFRHFAKPAFADDMHRAVNGADREIIERVSNAIAHYEEHHVEDLIDKLGLIFVPLFFVMTGMSVKIETLFNLSVLGIALGITAAAVIGKYISGYAAGRVNKPVVGFGMVPRGEVGLIFAATGKALGLVNEQVFSVIVIMVVLTTLLTPPILTLLLKQKGKSTIRT